jgi:uncharacterized protein YndB with AHSA1/START domain
VNQTDTSAIRLDQYIDHPPHKVWRALTEPNLIKRWWVQGNIAATVGHHFELDMQSWGMIHCTVLEVEEGHLISYSFGDHWTISWRIEPEGAGSRLYLLHSGFDSTRPEDRNAFDGMEPGWREKILPALARVTGEV